jgi:hypothetical protein
MHNMKESEYLSWARHLVRTDTWVEPRYHVYGLSAVPGTLEPSEHQRLLDLAIAPMPQPPLTAWVVRVSWALLGDRVAAPRIAMILFAVAAVAGLFLLASELTDEALVPPAAALTLAVLPVHVFFGRAIQPESPALALLLLGSAAFARGCRVPSARAGLMAGLLLALSGLFKVTFLPGALPLLALAGVALPKADAGRRRRLLAGLAAGSALLPAGLAATWLDQGLAQVAFAARDRLSPLAPFGRAYWQSAGPSVARYLDLEFSGGILLLAGAGLSLVAFSRGRAPRLRTYLLGWLGATAVYVALVADFLPGHGYYLLPLAPPVCLAGAGALGEAGRWLALRTGRAWTRLAPLALLVAALPGASRATDAHFDTVFVGLDVAADYLRCHSRPDERLFVVGHHQSAAACYLADRYCAFWPDAAGVRRGENALGFRWFFLHGRAGLGRVIGDPSLLCHIESTYRIRQATFLRTGTGIDLQTILLEKGGTSDLRSFWKNRVAAVPTVAARYYRASRGTIVLYIVEDGGKP